MPVGRLGIAVLGVVAACSGPAASPAPIATALTSPTVPPTPPPTVAATSAPSAVASPIFGTWTRMNVCEEALAEFHDAGLDDQIPVFVVGNFVGEAATPEPGHECDDARPPEEHSHFFTADGEFGSLDAEGAQVDDGRYELVDADTLSFASHGLGLGYDGDILVDFTTDGDTATFSVNVPDRCKDACRLAHGWALSAFFGPTEWTRND